MELSEKAYIELDEASVGDKQILFGCVCLGACEWARGRQSLRSSSFNTQYVPSMYSRCSWCSLCARCSVPALCGDGEGEGGECGCGHGREEPNDAQMAEEARVVRRRVRHPITLPPHGRLPGLLERPEPDRHERLEAPSLARSPTPTHTRSTAGVCMRARLCAVPPVRRVCAKG